MDIVIIGSGNVASVFGRKFKAAGHQILQIVSRNASSASKLAYELDTESSNYTSIINREAEVYIIAVPDDAIVDLVADMQLPGKVVAHTAASVSKDVLKNVTSHYGVFYPLQSLRKEDNNLTELPMFYDGSDEITKKKLASLANSISPQTASHAGDDTRMKLHVAAVIVNNFTNHLYTLAEAYCKKEGLDFKQMLPLINETTKRLNDVMPSRSQTGPAARSDEETIQKHLALLSNHPELKKVYEFLSASIRNTKEE